MLPDLVEPSSQRTSLGADASDIRPSLRGAPLSWKERGRRLRAFGGRAPRWLRSIVVAIVGVYVLYLLAANVILRTHLLRGWLSKDERFLKVDYGSARSLYPGHVVVHDLRIRFQDQNVQMSIGIDRADLDIDLWKLAHRVARFESVRAQGVVYRLRLKMESLDGSEGRVAAFPPIEGFADPPLLERDAPPPPPPTGPGWTIEIRDIEATVRDVWTMEYRFRGEATLAGGFHLHPRTLAYVTPSVMRTRGGLLSLGDREFIRGGDWSLDAQVDPFVPQAPKGIEILRHITFTVHQHGGVVSLAALGKTYLPASSPVKIEDGAGPIGVDVHVDHGIVQADSRITYHTDEATVRAPPFVWTGDVDFTTKVATVGEHASVVAEATSGHVAMTPRTDLRDLSAEVDLGGVDLTAPIVIARLAGALKSAHLPDLRAWQPIAHDAVTFDGGGAMIAARAEYKGGALEGRIDARLDKVAMSIGPFAFVCSGTTATNVASQNPATSIAFPGARLDVHDVGVRLLKGHAEGMWLRARSDNTRIATSGATATDADIAIESGPGEQTVLLFTRLASLPDVAADATHGTQLAASVHLRVRHDDIEMGVRGARNGVLQGRGALHKTKNGGASGAFLISVGPVYMGLDIVHGNISVRPLAGGSWLDETLQRR